jgi:NADH:ubiquinone oxidoreductase subunit 2 (subunit N)
MLLQWTNYSFIIILVISISFFTFNYLNLTTNSKSYSAEITFLLLVVLLSLLLLLSISNLFYLYLVLELIGFITYILLAKNMQKEYEGLVKYFIFNNMASLTILFSISYLNSLLDGNNIVYLIVDLSNTAIMSTHSTTLFFATLLFVFGLVTKIGALPFSWWIVDLYENTSLNILGFLILLLKTGYVLLLLKLIIFVFFPIIAKLTIVFFIIGLFSLCLGAFASIIQLKLKRFIAYTSLNQIGYVFLSLSIINYYSYYITITYLLTYMLTIAAFSILLSQIQKHTIKSVKKNLVFLTDFKQIRLLPIHFRYIFIILLFSLSALPPFLGFFTKYILLLNFIKSKYFLLPIVILLIGVVSIYYYMRITKLIFFDLSKIDLVFNVLQTRSVQPYYINYLVFLTLLGLSSIILLGIGKILQVLIIDQLYKIF